MQLNNSLESETALRFCILDYYEGMGRAITDYKSDTGSPGFIRSYFLVDRRHVIRYSIGNDPNPQGDRWVGGVEIGIGPDFFHPMQFWSYEQGERFSMEASTEAVAKNLRLLDEFWQSADNPASAVPALRDGR